MSAVNTQIQRTNAVRLDDEEAVKKLSFETPLINPEDVDIPVCVANADEAIAIIQSHKKAQIV